MKNIYYHTYKSFARSKAAKLDLGGGIWEKEPLVERLDAILAKNGESAADFVRADVTTNNRRVVYVQIYTTKMLIIAIQVPGAINPWDVISLWRDPKNVTKEK
jgi:hypothetical protein